MTGSRPSGRSLRPWAAKPSRMCGTPFMRRSSGSAREWASPARRLITPRPRSARIAVWWAATRPCSMRTLPGEACTGMSRTEDWSAEGTCPGAQLFQKEVCNERGWLAWLADFWGVHGVLRGDLRQALGSQREIPYADGAPFAGWQDLSRRLRG